MFLLRQPLRRFQAPSPDRNKFEEVRTKDTMVHKKTLAICKIKMTNKLNQLKEDY